MAQEDISMGPEARIHINNQSFVWTGGNIALQQKEHDTNDSSDPNWDQFRGGRRRLTAEGGFQSEKNRNIHAGPYNLGNDEFVDVKVFPDGDDDGQEPYHAQKWLATNIRIEMPVKAGDVVTGTISGGSSGPVIKPGDT